MSPVDPERFEVVGGWIEAGPGDWSDHEYWRAFARVIVDYPAGMPEPWALLGQRPNLDLVLVDVVPFTIAYVWQRLRHLNVRAVRYVVPEVGA